MSSIQTLRVDCGGRAAEVEIVGEGPDVVIVGTATPMAFTRPAAVALAARGFRVVNFDYGSDGDDPEPRTALAQVADVYDVLVAAAVETCVPVGVSRGGMTAFGLAAHHPEVVRRLVLVAPVAGWSDVINVVGPMPDPDPDDPDSVLKFVFTDGFLEASREAAWGLLTAAPGTVDRVAREDEVPFTEDLRVRCPTLIVVGGGDKVVAAEHPARYLAEIEGSELLEVPDASHGWIMEDPEAFAAAVGPFMAG